MWADNETDVDLLGFEVHKDLIKGLVTNDGLLPLTVGLFGDWGGGKSSILRMLQRDLSRKGAHTDVACLYFSGWMFEGYDDAKAALISSVLLQLGEHRRFGPKIRRGVASLLKRVELMRVLPALLKHGGGPLASMAFGLAATHFGMDPHTILATTPVATVLGSAVGTQASNAVSDSEEADEGEDDIEDDLDEDDADDDEDESADEAGSANRPEANSHRRKVDWAKLIAKDKSKPSQLDIRTFRRDFERLLAETDLRALVVLIDDLDRCMPDRLIENLEAVRLFLAVPKTSFVIAADERIVRHAVSVRYAAPRMQEQQPASQGPYDLVTDYVEKLIQVPYHLPRLSPSEIETYATLLFCQLHLDTDQFKKVREACVAARKTNLYATFGVGMVREALGDVIPEQLGHRLQWTGAVAPAFTEGLKGNPRQVKRFLNALMLRRQFADIAGLTIRDDVLVKLMLLEYARKELFDDLYAWQARAQGQPRELRRLEERQAQLDGATDGPHDKGSAPPLPEGVSAQWAEPAVEDWIKLEPLLKDVDLRDYFWIARDKLRTSVGNLTMVSPVVRRHFESLISSNDGERRTIARESRQLETRDLGELLQLLQRHVQHPSDGHQGVTGLAALAREGSPNASEALLNALSLISPSNADPSTAFELQILVAEGKIDRQRTQQLLLNWSKTQTRIGATAATVLAELTRD
jgi:hypothetical protein